MGRESQRMKLMLVCLALVALCKYVAAKQGLLTKQAFETSSNKTLSRLLDFLAVRASLYTTFPSLKYFTSSYY